MTHPLAAGPLAIPRSREDVLKIQREQRRNAFVHSLRSPFHKARMPDLDPARLDDDAVWRQIPILDKEELRALGTDEFLTGFNQAPMNTVWEFWRSGGSTGKPLFYPRSFADRDYCLLSFARSLDLIDLGPGDLAHIAFPLGIHPVGHMFARVCQAKGVGVNWSGSGAQTPSTVQLQLIRDLQPTVWMGMSSYALHLANLAEAEGIDLAGGSVRKIVCSAEPLSKAKREKIERSWGAEVFDTFGMTECGLMSAEGPKHDGLVAWDDMFLLEVLDPDTLEPVPEGEVGTLVVTSLWTNHATPFIRWSSGDLVSLRQEGETEGHYAIFPVLRHAHRTSGFFKVRGVNITHSDFEDMMFRNLAVNDFKCEAVATGTLDQLRVSVELKRDADADAALKTVAEDIKRVFEITAEIVPVETGVLAREAEASIKAVRFFDRR